MIPAPRSDKISPNIFSMTNTSYFHGCRTRSNAIASTYLYSVEISGYRSARSSNTWRKNAIDRKTFALSTQVTTPGPPSDFLCIANWNAKSKKRSQFGRVISRTSLAIRSSSTRPEFACANKPSVDSRRMTISMSFDRLSASVFGNFG